MYCDFQSIKAIHTLNPTHTYTTFETLSSSSGVLIWKQDLRGLFVVGYQRKNLHWEFSISHEMLHKAATKMALKITYIE